jgi:O-acetyl-ADP-ribose deacetylase (regulator of RNase III)
MTIQYLVGDLLKQEDVDAIVNTVNCVGIMGKGIALQFKNKWPDNFKLYKTACAQGLVEPGKMFVFDAGALAKPHYIINFPTKQHWRASSKIDFIKTGLEDLVFQVQRLSIQSIAIPPLGCGNGGLDWAQVKPLIVKAFECVPDVQVRLFEPGDTPTAKAMQVRTERPKMTAGRAAILKVLDTYRELNYGLSKIEVQKLGYFLQVSGQDLKLSFSKHTCGPYSDKLRHALNRMEGHFVKGVGDGVVEADIEPLPDALSEADRFVSLAGDQALIDRLERLRDLIDGFQSPYGMELLATVHWVAHNNSNVNGFESALTAIGAWSERKKELMEPAHVRVAWDRLDGQGWLRA